MDFKKQLVDAVTEYCDDEGLSKKDKKVLLSALERLDFRNLSTSDWFVLFDAAGLLSDRNDFSEGIFRMGCAIWADFQGVDISKEDEGVLGHV